MKNILVASIILCLPAVSQGATISCQPSQADVIVQGVGTSASFTCNPGGNNINNDGLAIDRILLYVSGSFHENAAPTGSAFSVLFGSSTPAGVPGVGLEGLALNGITCLATAAENGFHQALGSCVGSHNVPVLLSPDQIGSFNVIVTGGSGPSLQPFNASASVSYEVLTLPLGESSAAPEPSTWALILVGAVGVAFARKGAWQTWQW